MKKYLGLTALDSFMNKVLDVFPSKELSEDDTTNMWGNIINPPKVIEVAPDGAASNWSYTLDEDAGTITLNQYTGSETDVTVYGKYQINGKEYNTKIGDGRNTGTVSYMFNGYATTNCQNIQTITFNEGIDTSECTNMSFMFYKCSALTKIIGLEYFDTSNVTNMASMFDSCSALTSLDLRSFNTSSVTSMEYMLGSCSSLTSLDLRSFDTSNVKYMKSMFSRCTALTSLDLRSFDTSNVIDMYRMFYACTKLTEIKATKGKWVIKSGCDISNMFYNCGVSAVTEYPAA